MTKRIGLFIQTVAIGAILSGCLLSDKVDDIKDAFSREPEVEGIAEALKTAIPLAYAASLAMGAVNGNVAPNVTILDTPTTFPTGAILAIDISSAYPLPVGSDTSGTIFVGGLWSSEDDAILTFVFTDLNISEGTFTLNSLAFCPVQRDSNQIMLVYATEDINSAGDTVLTLDLTPGEFDAEFTRLTNAPTIDSSVSVDQDAWIVTVDRNQTYADGTDDTYTILGASQYAGVTTEDASVIQRVIIGGIVAPSCHRNPTEGYALVRQIQLATGTTGENRLGTSLLDFHPTCDGRVDVAIATGNYVGSTGSSVDLGLDQ